MNLVNTLEILLRRDKVVQVPHVCSLLVCLITVAQPPDLGPLAHLEVLEFTVNQILQLIRAFVLNFTHVEQVS